MNAPADWTPLDRSVATFIRHRSHFPELLRQLVAVDELLAMIPYHPEVDGEMIPIENGSDFPFVLWSDAEGHEVVPIFSSPVRFEEAISRQPEAMEGTSAGCLAPVELFEILAAMNFRAVLNPYCKTGSFTMSAALMADLASGRALEPHPNPGPTTDNPILVLDPADYPTDLVQALFEVLRSHRQFQAAWIFGSPEPAVKPGRTRYELLVLMTPLDPVLLHDLDLVAQNVSQDTAEVHLGCLPTDDAEYLRSFMARVPAPFYGTRGRETQLP